jgi:hypothetical protein
VLRTLPLTDRTLSVALAATLGADAASLVAKQGNYDGTRAADGMLTMAVQAMANGFGLEWGRLLTAGKRTDSTATNGTGVDSTASTAFGLQAYLHIFAFTGTSVTVKLQESSDNGGTDPYADVVGGAFTAAAAIGTQRIQTARNQTVKRWLRVVTTGTFSNVIFSVSVAKNEVSVTF